MCGCVDRHRGCCMWRQVAGPVQLALWPLAVVAASVDRECLCTLCCAVVKPRSFRIHGTVNQCLRESPCRWRRLVVVVGPTGTHSRIRQPKHYHILNNKQHQPLVHAMTESVSREVCHHRPRRAHGVVRNRHLAQRHTATKYRDGLQKLPQWPGSCSECVT